jgi:hypothetical protein
MTSVFWLGNSRIDYLGYLGVDGRIILEWVLGKESAKMWTGDIWLRVGNQWHAAVNTVIRPCSITGGEIC